MKLIEAFQRVGIVIGPQTHWDYAKQEVVTVPGQLRAVISMHSKDRYLVNRDLNREVAEFLAFGPYFCFAAKKVGGYVFFVGTTSEFFRTAYSYSLSRVSMEKYREVRGELTKMKEGKIDSFHDESKEFEAWALVNALQGNTGY
jgi:hypothetical protein